MSNHSAPRTGQTWPPALVEQRDRPLLAELQQMFAAQASKAEAWDLHGARAVEQVEQMRTALMQIRRIAMERLDRDSRTAQIRALTDLGLAGT